MEQKHAGKGVSSEVLWVLK